MRMSDVGHAVDLYYSRTKDGDRFARTARSILRALMDDVDNGLLDAPVEAVVVMAGGWRTIDRNSPLEASRRVLGGVLDLLALVLGGTWRRGGAATPALGEELLNRGVVTRFDTVCHCRSNPDQICFAPLHE